MLSVHCRLLTKEALPCDSRGDKELRAVSILASIGHTQKALLGVLQLEVFIGELLSVDRLATSAVSLGEITPLDHKVFDNSMKG